MTKLKTLLFERKCPQSRFTKIAYNGLQLQEVSDYPTYLVFFLFYLQASNFSPYCGLFLNFSLFIVGSVVFILLPSFFGDKMTYYGSVLS